MELFSKSLGTGLILLLLTLPVELLFNGLGLSRVSNYFDHYQGSMSWAHYRVAFRPQGTGQQPAPDLWFPNWRYGFNLENCVALRADVLQAEVPLTQVSPLLYDTTRFAAGFSPDSVYEAWVGLRGNYLSYAFGVRPAAQVFSWQAVAAPTSPPAYAPQPYWSLQLWLYAWAALTLPMWFFAAGMAVGMVPEYRRVADRLAALLLVVLFVAARGYVDWLDYSTGEEWPVMGPVLVLLLLGAYGYQLLQPVPTEEAPEEVAVGQAHTDRLLS